MRTPTEIKASLKKRLLSLTGQDVESGTFLDLFTFAVSYALGDAHKEIEKNKTPHIYTTLSGRSLDDLGHMVNTPRRTDEDDDNYLYRLMNWLVSTESSNETAINIALSTLSHGEAEFFSLTNGSGTGTVYIVPKSYEEETIASAVKECKVIIESVASPGVFVDYVTPEVAYVTLGVSMSSNGGDVTQIRENIRSQAEDYINSLPPNGMLNIGDVNKIGINEPNVSFFQVAQVFIGNEEKKETTIPQKFEEKFILDEIIWH